MNFIFNLTIREIRSSWRRLLFFFLCIAIGVGAVVTLRSLIQNLNGAIGGDARALMTADIELSSTSDFSPSEISLIEQTIGKSNIIEDRNEFVATSAAARPVDETNESFSAVEIKGIEPKFPMVGDFTLTGGQPFDFSLLENNGTVVAPIVLQDLNVKVGDKIKIGDAEFTIRATFDEEPGGSGGIRLGGRVFIAKNALDLTGITQNRSRVRRYILYRTSENPTALAKELRETLKGTILRVRSYRETQERLGEQFAKTENYLSLTGLLILVLGGVGVWNVARAFVEQKKKSVAVLKCLGASGNRIITIYLLQIMTLGLIGSLFGVLLAQLTLWFAAWRFGESLPAKMSYGVPFSAAWQGILLGLLISLLFSALPLLQVRNIKPNLLLRDETGEKMRGIDWTKWTFGAACLAGLIGLATWQAGSIIVGTIFLVALFVTSSALFLVAAVLVRLLKSAKNVGSFAFSQAINSLYRPGNQTRIILLAVGLGVFVVLAVQSLQTNLVREFDFSRNERLPTMFFIDIQPSQIKDLETEIQQQTGEKPETIPLVRTRVTAVNGEPFDFNKAEMREQQGQIGREFNVTYRPNLDKNESVISGEFWKNTPLSENDIAEVSILDTISEDLNAGVGDYLTFDISGRKINALITNVRKIDIRNTRTAFVFVFRPGSLEKAPQTYAATTLKRIPEVQRQKLQRATLDKFPNVQVFDVANIISVVQDLINNFVLAISFVGSFVGLSGILILIGSIALTKSQRVYENAILKTLGAKRPTLTAILFAEYGIVGLLAGIIGAFFAVILSYVVSEYLLNINWIFNPFLMISGIIITTILVMLVGALASFDVLFKKPLNTLRSQ